MQLHQLFVRAVLFLLFVTHVALAAPATKPAPTPARPSSPAAVAVAPAPIVPPTFMFTVDTSRLLSERIATSRFDKVHPWVTAQNFPTTPASSRTVTAELFPLPYRQMLTTEQVKQMIAREGYRPATLDELLAFSAAYPDEVKNGGVTAFDSVWDKTPNLSCIPSWELAEGKRWLLVRTSNMRWPWTIRFLVVKK